MLAGCSAPSSRTSTTPFGTPSKGSWRRRRSHTRRSGRPAGWSTVASGARRPSTDSSASRRPEDCGGLGISDFRFNAVINEEVAYAGVVGDNFSLQNDIMVPYLLELTDRRAEAPLAARADDRRQRVRDRHDRARRRLRPARDERQRPARRRRLRPRRLQDVRHERDPGRPRDRRRPDRPGLQPVHGRGRDGGLRARPQARQGRPPRPGHRGAVLQRRLRPAREPARRGGHGPALPDGAAAARAAVDRGRRRRRLRARADDHARLRARAARLRAADRVLPAQPLHAGVAARQGPGRARVHRRLRSWRSTTAG